MIATAKNEHDHLNALIVTLDASPTALTRSNCRGWVGDWQISGTGGHVLADGAGYLLYAQPGTARRWKNLKKTLHFCQISQDSDDEGCLQLDHLPTVAEAMLIREALGIRQRRHLSPETLAAMTARLPQIRDKSRVPGPGSPQTVRPIPEAILGRLAIFELPDERLAA